MPFVDVAPPDVASRTVVFVHGTPGDRTDFDEVAALAPAGFRTRRFEMLDHGGATDELRPDFDAHEEDLLRGLGDLRGPVTLVGYSVGAHVAARVLSRAQSPHVDRAVFVSGFATFESAEIESRLEIADALARGSLDAETLAGLLSDLILGRDGDRPDLRARIKRLVAESSVARLERAARRSACVAVGGQAIDLRDLPVVVIHAVRERAVPVDRARALAARGVCTRLLEIDTDSHALPWTHAGEIAGEVYGNLSSPGR